jgi:agmatinase
MVFDPDAAARPGSGVFGLPTTRQAARVVLLPVPFDATTSYGGGTSEGPKAIREASAQVDLYDRKFGRVYEQGIFMEEPDMDILLLSRKARGCAERLIAKGGASAGPGACGDDARDIAKIDAAGETVNQFAYDQTKRILAENKIPGLIGGDHSTPFGAIRACAEHVANQRGGSGDLGILHIDAHMDFRVAFEGFRWSHASIMYNVLTQIPQVTRIIQVGLRDFGEGELDFGIEQGRRVVQFFDEDIFEQTTSGITPFPDIARGIVQALPDRVYVSFDVDGLDPSLCPHTGTPVPGGLAFHQATAILHELRQSGKQVVGFDLVEVCPCPGEGEPEWDANVGARLLYKLCGLVSPRR